MNQIEKALALKKRADMFYNDATVAGACVLQLLVVGGIAWLTGGNLGYWGAVLALVLWMALLLFRHAQAKREFNAVLNGPCECADCKPRTGASVPTVTNQNQWV